MSLRPESRQRSWSRQCVKACTLPRWLPQRNFMLLLLSVERSGIYGCTMRQGRCYWLLVIGRSLIFQQVADNMKIWLCRFECKRVWWHVPMRSRFAASGADSSQQQHESCEFLLRFAAPPPPPLLLLLTIFLFEGRLIIHDNSMLSRSIFVDFNSNLIHNLLSS